ncbi:hypothetical protein GE061_001892 [Apolygus lucorum]|uniref:Integrase catalytic domain-containing protein n=1 Tax=Apolygus lucorum TaxID=248454 RepID=A0A6A4JGT9_APOLU|nr:hypothetical protein GE061_001892 [Apolygus lucorum]
MGSQFSFVTEACARKLGKSYKPFHGSISGVNQSPLSHASGILSLSFKSISSSLPLETDAVVVPTITSPLPQVPLQSSIWIDYQSYQLSDPNFTQPGPISFLIGADLFPEVVIGAPITIHYGGPKLINTIFGFTVIGKFDASHQSPSTAVSFLSTCTTTVDPDFLIEKFWQIEEPSASHFLSPEDEKCEDHFNTTHHRTPDGRYVVSLPFAKEQSNIVPNIKRALSRFHALENKLSKDDALRDDYINFMQQYLDLGHMYPTTDPPSYVIPHHPVYKLDAEGIGKLRVVFDASFKTASGSLNDNLLTGCKLQADICEVMLNFRRFKYVLTCDIVKMFRQILVEASDHRFQQIIWRFNPSEPIQFFALNTVTYGLRSSPYQAQRVLQQLVQDEGDRYPLAAEAMTRSLYVDDVAAGSNTIEDLFELKSQLINLLIQGGFELSKWNSNHPPLLQGGANSSQSVILPSEDETTKILGMRWHPTSDTFSYSVIKPPSGYTKRIILSTIARLYDPLGYLSPVVFYAKCLLQETWKSGVGWDEEVPEPIKAKWTQYTDVLQSLSNIIIPRAFAQSSSYQLVCFSDASEKGYCGVIYLRATFGDSSSLTLIKSKTKLAPLKMVTIPRLELCGALLLSDVVNSVDHLIKHVNINHIYCFTDSTTVLSWINTPVHRLQTFVANRVQQINDKIDKSCWYHIRGVENPADIGSRGILPSDLQHHTLWWTGPSWCTQPIESWPVSQDLSPPVDLPELKTQQVSFVAVDTHDNFISYMERHSSYLRLVRVVAYIKRFIHNCRIPAWRKRRRIKGPISAREFDGARKHCIRATQHHYYPQVVSASDQDELPLELRRLSVFLDHEKVIRVGGRLVNADIPNDHKFPILLHPKSHFANLIIRYLHRSNHHLGPSALLATVRQTYWIPKARNLVKYHKTKCVVCLRFSRAFKHPFMGNLPASRFNAVRPFINTGVDFAGPFVCRVNSLRNAKTEKAYLCLFICLSTRALHLELATSLSVEAFIDALDRFTARRGLPCNMYSDCGTNFQGAARYLKEVADWMSNEITQEAIITRTSHQSITWNFNPPFAPHFGGSWEAGVKSLKTLLVKSFGNHPFTSHELNTMFVKAEGVLNSRPLQSMSDSPDDLEALTAGHFLIGQPLNALPELDLSDIPEGRLSRWQFVRQRMQHFWARWRDEYLSTLQVRQKWSKHVPNLRVNDLVIVSDRNAAPMEWPLARIVATHPGDDGVVRVVTLKTARGTYKRPIVNLILIPSSDP